MSIRLTAAAAALTLSFAASTRAALYTVLTDTTIRDASHAGDQVVQAGPSSTLTLAPGGQTQSLGGINFGSVVIAPNTAQGLGGVTGEVFIGSGASYDQQGGAVTGNVYLGLVSPEGATSGQIRGGACLGLFVAQGSSATVSRGTIAANGVNADERSSVDIIGGTIGGPLFADNDATITLEGIGRDLNGDPGVYTGRLSTGTGGKFIDSLFPAGPGLIQVRGYNLVYRGGVLSGNLDDGGLIRSPVAPGTNLYVNGVAVVTPEPAALAMLAGGVGLACRRRRR